MVSKPQPLPTSVLREYLYLDGGTVRWRKPKSNSVKAGQRFGNNVWRNGEIRHIRGQFIHGGVRYLMTGHDLSYWLRGLPAPANVDHIDQDPTNNSHDNLRDGSGGVNERNRKRMRNRASRFGLGISYVQGSRVPWKAGITSRGARKTRQFRTWEQANTWRRSQEQALGYTSNIRRTV